MYVHRYKTNSSQVVIVYLHLLIILDGWTHNTLVCLFVYIPTYMLPEIYWRNEQFVFKTPICLLMMVVNDVC